MQWQITFLGGNKKVYTRYSDELVYDLARDIVLQENARLRNAKKPTMDREESETLLVQIMRRIKADVERYPSRSEEKKIIAAVTAAHNKLAG